MRKDRRLVKKVLLVLVFVFSIFGAFSIINLKTEEANAASLSNFDPGNIMSDFVLSNYNSMSLDDIQRFLKEHGNCNNTDTWITNYYTYHYHVENGHFVCLADERFGEGNVYGDALPAGEGESAAKIIYDVSQEYKINPQVLIVLLEKEQGLITDSLPHSIQYRSATGFGCPDTAACDSKYYGLKNQLTFAARLFRTVLDGGWTNYPVGDNYIQYNPSASCGGSIVNVKNRATSALYRYTPYQPNAGALAAGYGQATCGSYGNRNFYLYFMDWFGDPAAASYTEGEITEGVFQISSGNDLSKAIDVEGGVFTNGRNIQVYRKWDGNLSQEWELVSLENNEFAIVNPTSGLVLSVPTLKNPVNGNVVLSNWENKCSNRWKVDYLGNYYYKIVSSCNDDLVLDLENYDRNVQIYQMWGDNNKAQLWRFSKIKTSSGKYSSYKDSPVTDVAPIEDNKPAETPVDNTPTTDNNTANTDANINENTGNSVEAADVAAPSDFTSGSYVIRPLFNENLAIDVDYARKENRTNIKVFKSSAKNVAQEWTFVKRGDYYIIRNPYSGKVLDVANGNISSNTNVWLYEDNDSCAQRWKLIPHDASGGYVIANACNEKMALDVQDFATNVQVYMRWGDYNKAQIWRITQY